MDDVPPRAERPRKRGNFWRILPRSARLRCPWCGQGRLFRDWFRMHANCSGCQRSFQREPGFYLGSIYFNYGLTALLVAVGYPLLAWWQVLSIPRLNIVAVVFVVLFPIWFFRYARSLWLGFDQYVDPDAP